MAQQAGVELKAGPGAVEPVPTSAFPTPARGRITRAWTPPSCRRLRPALPPWQQGVARMLREI
jgi:dTDP-4-dehydrorhamnose reductase